MADDKRTHRYLYPRLGGQWTCCDERACRQFVSPRTCSQVGPQFAPTSHAEKSYAQTALWIDGRNGGYPFIAIDFAAGQWKAQASRPETIAKAHRDHTISGLAPV